MLGLGLGLGLRLGLGLGLGLVALSAQPTLSLLLHTSWVNWPHLLLATPGNSSSMSGSPPK